QCIDGGSCGQGSVGVLLNEAPFCNTPPTITLSATPNVLSPANGQTVPITLSGMIAAPGCTIKAVTYAVADQNGPVLPSGAVNLAADGSYNFTVDLKASRDGGVLAGHIYTISVSASNNVDIPGSQSVTVSVPHDRGQ